MRMKKICFLFFIAITLIGIYPLGIVQALNFADWSPIWFKVKVSETGKAGIVVSDLTPNGGEVVTNNEKTYTAYLNMGNYVDSSFSVNYCTFNGTRWELQEGLPMEIVGGEPERFLTLFNFNRRQSQNITEQYWVAIEVKGKEASNTIGDINSASFKHLGGIFLEEIGTPVVTQRGIGSVKFTGSLIKGTEEVESTVPLCCTSPAQCSTD
jgi:hypothetical protein